MARKKQEFYTTNLRLPKPIARLVKRSSDKNGTSINTELVHLISTGLMSNQLQPRIDKLLYDPR